MDTNTYLQILADGTKVFRRLANPQPSGLPTGTYSIQLKAFNPDESVQGSEYIDYTGTWPDPSWTVVANAPDLDAAILVGGVLSAPATS